MSHTTHQKKKLIARVSRIRGQLEAVERALEGERPCAIYDMVMNSVEKPLLEIVLHRVSGNQTQAAQLLGVNRNTLRKKMKYYGIK